MTRDLAFGRRIELSRNLRNKTVHLSVVFSRDDVIYTYQGPKAVGRGIVCGTTS
jgi:hypothetical protein